MTEDTNHSVKREYEEDENDVCSLQDVIDTEKERNDIATAVLGASDAVNCSYDKGYIYRQALYGCATCFKETNELHGICLACSYSCHPNHDLYELYTKRNFRCDCGNKKFQNVTNASKVCKLQPKKVDYNELNKYNHNFKGLYCTCDRPYPDLEFNNSNSKIADNTTETIEENVDEEAMIQCSICEDWFHTNHLLGYEACINVNDDYDEMICHICMNKNQFLWYYQGYIGIKLEKSLNESDSVDVTSADDNHAETNVNIIDASTSKCVIETMKSKYKNLKLPINQTCYFLNGWRDSLCKCENCLNFYAQNDIKYLINNEDSIKYYEDKGKQEEEKTQINDENALINNELSKMNHVSKIEFLSNVNSFKQELKDFLANFATNGEVVKRENIEKFFDDLNQRKRQKLDTLNSMNYFCK